MSKNLVLVVAIGEFHAAIAELTIPTIKAYAERIGADFKCITEHKLATTFMIWERFLRMKDLLSEYDRVLSIDADAIVRWDCPSLFDIVPEYEMGMFNEGLLTTVEEKEHQKAAMVNAFTEYEKPFPEDWDGRFYNGGIMLAPKRLQWVYEPPSHESHANYFDQGYLNMQLIMGNSFNDVFDFGYKFNRMSYLDSKVMESRYKSYIIHYAGIRPTNLLEGINYDLNVWRSMQCAIQQNS